MVSVSNLVLLLRPRPDIPPYEERAHSHEAANGDVVDDKPADEGPGQGQIQRVDDQASPRWWDWRALLGSGAAGKETSPLDDGAEDGGQDGVEPELVSFGEDGRVPGHDVDLHVVELDSLELELKLKICRGEGCRE